VYRRFSVFDGKARRGYNKISISAVQDSATDDDAHHYMTICSPSQSTAASFDTSFHLYNQVSRPKHLLSLALNLKQDESDTLKHISALEIRDGKFASIIQTRDFEIYFLNGILLGGVSLYRKTAV
jgi:hypothetical protein